MVGLYQFLELGDDDLFARDVYELLVCQFVEHSGDIEAGGEEFISQGGHIDGKFLSPGRLEGAIGYKLDKPFGQIGWLAAPGVLCRRLYHSAEHVEVVQAEGGVEEQDFANGCLVDFEILQVGFGDIVSGVSCRQSKQTFGLDDAGFVIPFAQSKAIVVAWAFDSQSATEDEIELVAEFTLFGYDMTCRFLVKPDLDLFSNFPKVIFAYPLKKG